MLTGTFLKFSARSDFQKSLPHIPQLSVHWQGVPRHPKALPGVPGLIIAKERKSTNYALSFTSLGSHHFLPKRT